MRPAVKRRDLIITEPAQTDLDGIYSYIAEESAEIADRFVERFIARLHLLARTGVTGVEREMLKPSLRMHPYEKYCVYFRIEGRRFVVMRIIHSARDLDSIEF